MLALARNRAMSRANSSVTSPHQSILTGGSFLARHLPVALFTFGNAAVGSTKYSEVLRRLYLWVELENSPKRDVRNMT